MISAASSKNRGMGSNPNTKSHRIHLGIVGSLASTLPVRRRCLMVATVRCYAGGLRPTR